MRVAVVVAASELRVGGQGRVAAASGGSSRFQLPADGQVEITSSEGGGIRVRGRAGAGLYERLLFTSLDGSRFVLMNGRPYRGRVEVYALEGSLFAVNELPLEAYLWGVVMAELGSRSREERAALEAQAILSRTYVLANKGRFRSEGYDVRASVSDQAYGGVLSETAIGNDAVRSTGGLVLTYRGDAVSAFFHSTCGYSTASPEEAFRSVRPAPYLQPVSDRRPGGGYYCDIAPRFRWSAEWDGGQLRDMLRRTVPSTLGIDAGMVDEVRGLRIHRTGRSRRAVELRLKVGRGEIPIFGPDLRSVLRTPDGQLLGSTAIQLATSNRDGRVGHLTISGAGWGHGVGMCQWGAVGRARAGQDARTILTTYFPGARIARWY